MIIEYLYISIYIYIYIYEKYGMLNLSIKKCYKNKKLYSIQMYTNIDMLIY